MSFLISDEPIEPALPTSKVGQGQKTGFIIQDDVGPATGTPTTAKQPTELSKTLRGVGEAVAHEVTGIAGGLAGLAVEGGSELIHQIPLPVPTKEGLKAFHIPMPTERLKSAVQYALTYQPHTEAGAKFVDALDNPESMANPMTYLKMVGDFGETLKNQTDDPHAKAEIDLLYNTLLMKLPKAAGLAVGGAKRLMRGGESAAKEMQGNIAAFKRAGVDRPTLGQVSAGGLTKGSLAPENVVERQRPQVVNQMENLANRLSTARTSEEAGKAIVSAIEGYPEYETLQLGKRTVQSPTGRKIGGWMSDVRERETQLHDRWQTAVGKQTPVFLHNTMAALKKLATPVPGAEATTASLINRKLTDLYSRIQNDAGPSESLSVEAVENLRKSIGELTDPAMEARLTAKEYNTLYSSLKQDLEHVVSEKSPFAKKNFNDAFEFSRNMHDVSENIMQPILNTRLPERAFSAATSGTSEGASLLRTLINGDPAKNMPRLNPAETDALKSVVLRKLGDGDRGPFNADKFFQNWGKMHSDAKDVLFGKEGRSFRNDIDNIHKVVGMMQTEASTLYAIRNFATEHGAEGMIGAVAYLARKPGIAHVLLGGPAVAFITGRLITNPRFIKWLASATTKRPDSIVPLLANLQARMIDQPPEDQLDAKKFGAMVGRQFGFLKDALHNPSKDMVATDKLLNGLTGGSFNETISARVAENKATSPTAKSIADFLDSIDPGHTERALADAKRAKAGQEDQMKTGSLNSPEKVAENAARDMRIGKTVDKMRAAHIPDQDIQDEVQKQMLDSYTPGELKNLED